MNNASWSNRFEIKPGRWVYNPTDESREFGQQVLNLLQKKWIKPSYYYHLRSGGHVEALSVHLNNAYFATIDIKDFFGYISRSRITRALKAMLGYERAREIAKLSTVNICGNYPHKHHLPYGFVQSPLLASICLFESSFGKLINHIFENEHASVSVYMDDIVISSNDINELNKLYNQMLVEARKSKFVINNKKSKPPENFAIVFNIKIMNKAMEVEKERFLKFKNAYALSESENEKHGIGSYVGSVNKGQAELLL